MSTKSLKFKFNSQTKQYIRSELMKNVNLKQYIVNIGTDNPINGDSIFSDLKNNNIFFKPFDENVLNNDKIIIFIHPTGGDLSKIPLSYDTYAFDICVPLKNEIWETVNGERIDLIAYEIINSLENVSDKYKEENNNIEIEFANYKEGQNRDTGFLTLFAKIQTITKGSELV